MTQRTIAVVGAGGFAREVRWLIDDLNRQRERFEFLGFVVTDLDQLKETDSRDEVVGDTDWLSAERGRVDCLALGIGTPRARLAVGEQLAKRFPDVDFPALVHPSAQMDRDSCRIAEGVVVCAGTIATVNVELAPFSMVNLSCTLGHEAVVGRGTVLNPTVNISGGVQLGTGVLVGTGAQILQYVVVADGATIGAGAVVNKPVPAGTTVVGVPARPLG